jgi:hypothetical protein
MLATQLNHLVEETKIGVNSVVKLTKYLVQDVSNRRIIIVLGLEVIELDHGSVIGTRENRTLPCLHPLAPAAILALA